MPGDPGLFEFLEKSGHRIQDIYRGGRSWTELRRTAGKPTPSPTDPELEAWSLKAVGRLTHIDDPERLGFYRDLLDRPDPPTLEDHDERQRRLITMLAWGLESGQSGYETLDHLFTALWSEQAVIDELRQILDHADATSQTLARPSALSPEIPLVPHARYSRREVIAALGYTAGIKPKVTQGGILWVPQAQSDAFFVDLKKSERDYSPTTMYRDYAINRELFHWESQSRQHEGQPTVQRYINHRSQGTNVLLFVRERKQGELGTAPFTFLGPADYVSHQGERPVAFTWLLNNPMPEKLFEVARSVAAA